MLFQLQTFPVLRELFRPINFLQKVLPTIIHAKTVKDQLNLYGFKVLKVVSIGHHPERFKWCKNLKKNGILWNIVMAIGMAISKLFKLGDSMEVYAMKQGRLEDIK